MRIVTRIYANLRGLADTCYKANLVEKPSTVEDFARGFTGSKQLFDYIDVGSGKDRADDKITGKLQHQSFIMRTSILTGLVISEMFKLHLYVCQCRHIVFGCSHDNGYARVLEELLADQPTIKRVTLLEGVPFERELAGLKNTYQTTKFNTLFRTTKINIYHAPVPPSAPPQIAHQPSPVPAPAQVPRTASTLTSSSLNPVANSWAATAMTAPASVASPPPTPKPAHVPAVIPRNKYGQRVDPPLNYDKTEVNRVKKIHMCNVHFLRGDCPYGEGCSHDHSYKPTKNELVTLKYVARMTPCRFGTECDDPKCIYGHRCPMSREGYRDCHFKENCRFDADMHGIDERVVKVVKV